MLAIRLQRLGRKGMPMYRLAVQEAQRHPSSGKVVSYVGSYNPHTKALSVDVEKVSFYLEHGAQPTPRVVRLLQSEKIKLPSWVKTIDDKKQYSIKNLEKLRKNRPAEDVAEKVEVPTEEVTEEAPAAEEPAIEPEVAAEEPVEVPAEPEAEPEDKKEA